MAYTWMAIGVALGCTVPLAVHAQSTHRSPYGGSQYNSQSNYGETPTPPQDQWNGSLFSGNKVTVGNCGPNAWWDPGAHVCVPNSARPANQ